MENPVLQVPERHRGGNARLPGLRTGPDQRVPSPSNRRYRNFCELTFYYMDLVTVEAWQRATRLARPNQMRNWSAIPVEASFSSPDHQALLPPPRHLGKIPASTGWPVLPGWRAPRAPAPSSSTRTWPRGQREQARGGCCRLPSPGLQARPPRCHPVHSRISRALAGISQPGTGHQSCRRSAS